MSLSSPPESRSEKRAPRLASRLLAAPTLHFFVVGFVVLVSERAWTRAHTERPTLHVVVPTGLGPAEREKRVDAAVLIKEGLGLGWARTDHVIRTRLITNLRFARGETRPGDEDATSPAAPRDDDAALLEEALRLGMERSDLIVRRRIVSRAERMMTSDVRHAPVDDGTLLAFRDAHPERFRAPARFRYVDVFLSQQRRGDTLDHAVSATQAQLTAQQAAATSAREAASLAGERYRSGLVDFATMLQSERTQLSAEDAVAATRGTLATAQVRLIKALGGGWSPEEPASQR